MSTPLLLAIPDLAMASRINAAARKHGIASIATLSLHDLLSKAHGEEARLLILDLAAAEFPMDTVLPALKGDEHTNAIRVVGFHSTDDSETESKARTQGCDVVLSKNALLQNLDNVVGGLFD